MENHRSAPRVTRRSAWFRAGRIAGVAATLALVLSWGCGGGASKLEFVEPVAPINPQAFPTDAAADSGLAVLQALFAPPHIGFKQSSGDSTTRFLGRLKDGYTADTLNVILLGDNRPSYRTTELRSNYAPIREMFSLNPVKWAKGLVNIPLFLFKGTFPDAKLWRDIPSLISQNPSYGREVQVVQAVVGVMDSLEAKGQRVSCLINTGDLVKDGRYASQWKRFLDINRPITQRIPYFPIAGNHERTDDSLGLANWRTATGLPIASDRLYYCFDSADGWVRFVALDSNPMTDPKGYWPREVEVEYSKEQIDWLEARLAEHRGPAMVFLHHPPFALGFHRYEWELDDVLQARRAQMVKTLQAHGISILAAGHEHAYSRAFLTCGQTALIVITTGGAGSPLHAVSTGEAAASVFSEYKIEGCEFRPQDVMSAQVFHFILVRYWFGGGEIRTYAVDVDAKITEIDHVTVDLERYGVPKIDQEKMPILPADTGPSQLPPTEEEPAKAIQSAVDSLGKDADLDSIPKPNPEELRP